MRENILGIFRFNLAPYSFHCHIKNNNSVWVRYHWPSTKTIKILDPIEEKEVAYDIYMQELFVSFERISINFEQGEIQKSWPWDRGLGIIDFWAIFANRRVIFGHRREKICKVFAIQ